MTMVRFLRHSIQDFFTCKHWGKNGLCTPHLTLRPRAGLGLAPGIWSSRSTSRRGSDSDCCAPPTYPDSMGALPKLPLQLPQPVLPTFKEGKHPSFLTAISVSKAVSRGWFPFLTPPALIPGTSLPCSFFYPTQRHSQPFDSLFCTSSFFVFCCCPTFLLLSIHWDVQRAAGVSQHCTSGNQTSHVIFKQNRNLILIR